MAPHRTGLTLRFLALGCLTTAIVSGCALFPTAQTITSAAGGFTFSAPPGYTTREFESYFDRHMNAEYYLFCQKKPVYFQIYRQDKPAGGDLDAMVDVREAVAEQEGSHYRFISRDQTRFSEKQAIAYVYSRFSGEPYVRTRETWIDAGDQVYILACSQTVSVEDADAKPVSPECDRLMEGFAIQ